MSGLPRVGSTICRAIRLPSGDRRGQFCGWRSDSRTAVPSRATVPSRTPYGMGIATVASRSADALSIAGWYGVFAPAATGNVRGSPTSVSAAASKGRACNWPSAVERSTPRSRPDVGDEHRLRFRSEEWRAWRGRRPIEARDVHPAPLIDAGPHEEEEVDAVRQEDGPSMRILTAVEVDQRGGLHRAAVRRHPGKSLEDDVRAEHDRPCGTPRTALPVRRIADLDRYAARDRHFHQFAAGEKRDRHTVGRPERLLRSVGPFDDGGIGRVERPHEQAWRRIAADGGERDTASDRRDDRCGVERGARWKRPRELREAGLGGRAQCPSTEPPTEESHQDHRQAGCACDGPASSHVEQSAARLARRSAEREGGRTSGDAARSSLESICSRAHSRSAAD